MKMAPASAGGGQDAPAGADRQGRSRSSGRVSPEMRPGPLTLTGPQPPERTPVTAKDARERRHGCLLSATSGHIFVTQRHLAAAALAGRAEVRRFRSEPAGRPEKSLTLTPEETHQWNIGVAIAAAMEHRCRLVPRTMEHGLVDRARTYCDRDC